MQNSEAGFKIFDPNEIPERYRIQVRGNDVQIDLRLWLTDLVSYMKVAEVPIEFALNKFAEVWDGIQIIGSYDLKDLN